MVRKKSKPAVQRKVKRVATAPAQARRVPKSTKPKSTPTISQRRTVKVVLPSGLIVTAILTPYPAEDGRSIVHIRLQGANQPDPASGGQPSAVRQHWTQVVRHYEAAINKAYKDGKLPQNPDKAADILRCLALGLIGLSHPLKNSAVAVIQIPKKALGEILRREARERRQSDYKVGEILRRSSAGHPEVGTNGLRDIVRASLAGDALNPAAMEDYYKFEDRLLQEWQRICKRTNDRNEQLYLMGQHIAKLVKNADEATRQNLAILKAAVLTQWHEMHQWLMAQAMEAPAIKSIIDDNSYRYNLFAHAVQPALGGMVPAVHPLWDMLLEAPEFVSMLIDFVRLWHRAEAKSTRNATHEKTNKALQRAVDRAARRLMHAMAQGVLLYRRLLDAMAELEFADRTHELNPTDAEDSPTPDKDADQSMFLKALGRRFANDKDVQIALEFVMDRASVAELVQEHGLSPGTISKRKEKGLKKLRQFCQEHGITPETLADHESARLSVVPRCTVDPSSIDPDITAD